MYSINERTYSKASISLDKLSEESEDDEIDEEPFQKYATDKFKYQRKALFRKTLSLQWRQKWTNVCQIISPILGMLIVVLFKEIGFKFL
jgi:hypothetical protein